MLAVLVVAGALLEVDLGRLVVVLMDAGAGLVVLVDAGMFFDGMMVVGALEAETVVSHHVVGCWRARVIWLLSWRCWWWLWACCRKYRWWGCC